MWWHCIERKAILTNSKSFWRYVKYIATFFLFCFRFLYCSRGGPRRNKTLQWLLQLRWRRQNTFKPSRLATIHWFRSMGQFFWPLPGTMAIRPKWKFPGVTELGPFPCLWRRWLCCKFRIHKQHCQTNNFQFAQIWLDRPSNPRHLASIQYLQCKHRIFKYCNVLFWDIADWLWQSFLDDRHACAN